MAIQLKVRPDELQKAASEIQNEIRDVETAFRSLGEAITSSRSYWEGDASEAHQKFYDSGSMWRPKKAQSRRQSRWYRM